MLGLGVNITKPSVKGTDTWSTPADFGSNLILWYRKGATNFIEEGSSPAAPPTTQGDEVKQWTDSSIFLNDAVNSTSANLPKIDIDNDGGSLWNNNSADFLDFTQITFSGAYAVYVLINPATVSGNVFISDDDVSDMFFRFNNSTEIRARLDGASMDWTTSTMSAGTYYRLGMERNDSDLVEVLLNGNVQIYDTGSSYGSSAVNSSTFTFDQIGGGSSSFTGRIKEVVIVNRVLTIPERVSLDQYFQTL